MDPVTVTVAKLLSVLCPGMTIEALNAGTYPGTEIPLRKIAADHRVTVDPKGMMEDNAGGWITARICGEGSRCVGVRVARRLAMHVV